MTEQTTESHTHLIPVPMCASHGCDRMGYVKSERYGTRLCGLHASCGPAAQPNTQGGIR